MSHFWTNISLAAPVNRGGAAYAAQYKKASVTMKAGTRHGPPQVIDIPTVGTPTPGRADQQHGDG